MYTPKFNAENDLATIHQFVRENPLCALVTETSHGMVASHIPMVLHDDPAGGVLLRGHVARANSQWQDFTASGQALGIFTGPQHYISASWYPGKHTHGKEVPTWNYVAVHVYGSLRAIEDPEWLLEHLRVLTDTHEVIAELPWKVADAPPDFISRLSRAIVGFELQVSRFEAKWKASQNRTDEDAAAVMDGLQGLRTPASAVMRDLVQARRPR